MLSPLFSFQPDGSGVARWQSGYAAACKAVYLGSIPGRASRISGSSQVFRPDGEIGRHKGLKIPFVKPFSHRVYGRRA